jgi:pilus assembly protein Flp/PilA
MRKTLERFLGVRRGQTTAEYAIIVALIAIASISVIVIFGDQIRAMFGAESKRLTGDDQYQMQDKTTNVDGAIDKTLKDF